MPSVKPTKPQEVGALSELKVFTRLTELGYAIATPLRAIEPWDCVVIDWDGRPLLAQVKTGRLTDGVVLFPTISSQFHWKPKGGVTYHGKVDIFLIYCYELDEVYWVPIGLISSGSRSARLRVDPPARPNLVKKNPIWAKDFIVGDRMISEEVLKSKNVAVRVAADGTTTFHTRRTSADGKLVRRTFTSADEALLALKDLDEARARNGDRKMSWSRRQSGK
jgi:hypothetical protein